MTTVLHIGKTGGVALTQALASASESHRLRLCGHDVTLKDVPAGEKVVFSVRHPVPRFVSGFNSRLRKGRPRNDIEWHPAERAVFQRFPTPRELAEALSSQDPSVRDAAEQAMRRTAHTRLSLAHWLVSSEYLLERAGDIVFPLWQPELDADFERIKEILALPAGLLLPHDSIGSHRTPNGFDTELSSTAVDNLERWYAADLPIYQTCLELRARRIAELRAARSRAFGERSARPA